MGRKSELDEIEAEKVDFGKIYRCVGNDIFFVFGKDACGKNKLRNTTDLVEILPDEYYLLSQKIVGISAILFSFIFISLTIYSVVFSYNSMETTFQSDLKSNFEM